MATIRCRRLARTNIKVLSISTHRLLSWLFALTLIFGQAAAFAHALSHLDDHDTSQSEPVCEVCVAQGNLGSAAPATGFSLTAAAACSIDLPVGTRPPAGICPTFSRARAPPHSI
jgi:hypothetical protein